MAAELDVFVCVPRRGVVVCPGLAGLAEGTSHNVGPGRCVRYSGGHSKGHRGSSGFTGGAFVSSAAVRRDVSA